jgi:Uma2 family endonuclease
MLRHARPLLLRLLWIHYRDPEDPMPTRPKIRYTYEDYLSTPEDSSLRHEIIDGELYVSATPRFRHQQVVASLNRILGMLAIEHGLGEAVGAPVTVHLRDDRVMEPDVTFVRADRLDIIGSDGRIHAPPDLVVEVLSPSNRDYDRTLKRKRYLASGVAEVWIVDADADTIDVWRPGAAEPVRPRGSIEWRVGDRAFTISLADVFRR